MLWPRCGPSPKAGEHRSGPALAWTLVGGARIGVLGPTTVSMDDRPLPLPPAQRSLLAALVLSGRQGASVEQLIDALWGDHPPRTAERTLHSHVSRLRSMVGVDVERPLPGRYALAAGVMVDVDEFESALARGRLAPTAPEALGEFDAAHRLWRGIPFSDLDDAPGARPERVRLQELRDQLDEMRLEALIASGARDAIARARALVDQEPLRERRWALLMDALYRDGRQAEALAAFQEARQCLIEELGVEPGPGLAEVERAILSHAPPTDRWRDRQVAVPSPRPSALPQSFARLRSRYPLHGRDDELAALVDAWSTVGETQAPALVVIDGEPGIGKTRLLAELAGLVADDGGEVYAARCVEGEIGAFRAIVEAVGAPVTEMIATGGEGSRISTGEDAGVACRRVADCVADQLRSRDGGALLAVDDAQWADASSLRAVRELVTRPRGAMLVVLTVRSTGPPRTGELGQLLCLRDDRAASTVLSLTGVDPESARRIVAHCQERHGREGRAAPIDVVVARSGGNPLHLVELARWRTAADAALPATLVALAQDRLVTLERSSRDLIEAGAVLGETFDAHNAAVVAGLDRDVIPDALHQAREVGLCVGGSPADVQFAHGVTREAVLGSLSAGRRARLEWAAGVTLEGTGTPETVARHLLAGALVGDPDRAARAALTAARDGRDQIDPEPALALLDEAERLVAPSRDHALHTRIELMLTQSQLLARSGDVSAAKSAALRASNLAEPSGDAPRFARCAIGYAELVNAGEPDPAAPALCHEALRQLGDDHPAVSAAVLAALANYHSVVLADPVTALHLADRAMALTPNTDRTTLAETLWARGCAQLGSSDVSARLVTAEALLDHTVPGDRRHVEALRLVAHTTFELGDRRGAQQAVACLGRVGCDHGSWDALLWSEIWRAQFALLDGDLDGAEQITGRVLDDIAGESFYATTLALTQRCHQHLERGSLPVMLPVLESVAETIDLPGVGAMLAAALVQGGELDRARALVERCAAARFDDLPIDQTFTGALARWIDVSLALGELDWARLAARRLAPYSGLLVVFLQGAVCFGAVDHHLGRVAAACGDRRQAERLLRNAELLERTTGAQLALLHTRTELVDLDRRAGRERAVADLRRLYDDAATRGIGRLADSIARRLANEAEAVEEAED